MNKHSKDVAMRMFNTALCTLGENNWKQPSCPVLGDRLDKIYT